MMANMHRWPKSEPASVLPGGDELIAEFAEAIDTVFSRNRERHVHPSKGGCEVCAKAAAEAVVRHLEENSRVIASDALGPDELNRLVGALTSLPYLGRVGNNGRFRTTGKYAGDPDRPTVADFISDVEYLAELLKALADTDNARDAELRKYRRWHEAVEELATEIVEHVEKPDPTTIEEALRGA